MNLAAIVGIVAGVLSLVAFVPYIFAILRKKANPNRASWFIWAVVSLMLGASYFASGARNTAWVSIGYIIGSITIASLSIKYGEGGWTGFDRFCLFATGISLILWLVFKNPLVALIINVFIDFFGALPTMRKAFRDPKSEDKLTWLLFFAGNLVNLCAVESLKFSIVVYPIWMFLGSGIITALVIWPRKTNRIGAS
jgi:hypothetical protein